MNRTLRKHARVAPGALRKVASAAVGGWLLAAASMATAQDSAELAAALRALVGTPACNNDDQCRTLPYGAKACGGPQSYLAWSVLVSDGDAVKAAAERFAARRRDELRASGAVSDCALVADPGAMCAAPASGSTDSPRACVLRGTKDGRGKVVR